MTDEAVEVRSQLLARDLATAGAATSVVLEQRGCAGGEGPQPAVATLQSCSGLVDVDSRRFAKESLDSVLPGDETLSDALVGSPDGSRADRQAVGLLVIAPDSPVGHLTGLEEGHLGVEVGTEPSWCGHGVEVGTDLLATAAAPVTCRLEAGDDRLDHRDVCLGAAVRCCAGSTDLASAVRAVGEGDGHDTVDDIGSGP